MQLCSGQKAIPTVQCCSAKQAHSRQFFTVVSPMKICCAYRCAVTQHQCSAALFRSKGNPHCSVLLCKTGSQQAVCHCSYTYGYLLFIQVCSDSAQMQSGNPHCSGQKAIPRFCSEQCCNAAALFTKLPAVLQSSNEQWGLPFDLNRAALHLLGHCTCMKTKYP